MTFSAGRPPPAWIDASCTLPSGEQPLRVAEFDELFADVVAVRRTDETTLALDLRQQPGLASRAAELAVRESQCCSFFAFAVLIEGDALVLRISVPRAHTAVLDALQMRVASS